MQRLISSLWTGSAVGKDEKELNASEVAKWELIISSKKF